MIVWWSIVIGQKWPNCLNKWAEKVFLYEDLSGPDWYVKSPPQMRCWFENVSTLKNFQKIVDGETSIQQTSMVLLTLLYQVSYCKDRNRHLYACQVSPHWSCTINTSFMHNVYKLTKLAIIVAILKREMTKKLNLHLNLLNLSIKASCTLPHLSTWIMQHKP